MASNENFERIMEGLRDAVEIAEGRADPKTYRLHVPPTVDVRAIRKALGLTQDAFASRFGFSAAAVKDWEQGRKQPLATARVLLTIIAREPDAVRRALELEAA